MKWTHGQDTFPALFVCDILQWESIHFFVWLTDLTGLFAVCFCVLFFFHFPPHCPLCRFRLQALMFGNGTDLSTIVLKTLVDQLVYSVLWSMPFGLTMYKWRDSKFNFRVVINMLKSNHFWKWQVPQTIIGSWIVWLPAVILVYCLPGPLQIPLFVLVSCFWSLLLNLLAGS